MKNLASFLESKNISVSSLPSGSSDNSSVSSSRRDTQGTLRREGIIPILSSSSRSTSAKSQNDELKTIPSPFLDKRRWINLGDGWHQATAQGSGSITRCGLYSVIESNGSAKTFGCLYIPRSDAAYNACMCDKPEYDLILSCRMHTRPNAPFLPVFEVIFAYKDGNNYLRIVCDGLAKTWSIVYYNGGKDYCLAQTNDNNIKLNLFYNLLIQIRGNHLSLDVNGIPIFTKSKMINISDLSGFMGLKATNSKFSVKGWKLKGLNVSKYRACIPSSEEDPEESPVLNTVFSKISDDIEGRATPMKAQPLSSHSTTPRSYPQSVSKTRSFFAETPELAIEGKPSYEEREIQRETASFASVTKQKGFPPELLEELFAMTDKNIAENVLQDIMQQNLNVKFDDIASLADAKRVLHEAIILPTMMPEFFTGIREPWKGILLYGPPGTGKTMLAKAVCGMQQSTFFNCSAATIISKYRGDSEKIIRCLFTAARILAPSVIFIDEIDALVSDRSYDSEHEASRRLKSELLCQIDGLGSNRGGSKQVVFLAATNCPWDLDPAMRRRLEKRIYVPLPDYEARIELISILIKDLLLSEDFNLSNLAMMTEGYSGADIQVALREASMMPMRRLLDAFSPDQIVELRRNGEITVPKVTMRDCVAALQNTRPSVAAASLTRFKAWEDEFGNK